MDLRRIARTIIFLVESEDLGLFFLGFTCSTSAFGDVEKWWVCK
jgi:hypothetical protein